MYSRLYGRRNLNSCNAAWPHKPLHPFFRSLSLLRWVAFTATPIGGVLLPLGEACYTPGQRCYTLLRGIPEGPGEAFFRSLSC